MRLLAPALASALWLLAASAETAELAPGPRIDWRHDGLRAVFDDAAADGKPLVIATEGDEGRFYAEVLRCPRLNSLAGAAHFVLIRLPVDDASEAGRLLATLHVDPAFASTVVVLRTTARPFVEVRRLRGYRGEASLLAAISEAGLTPDGTETAALADDPPRDCVN